MHDYLLNLKYMTEQPSSFAIGVDIGGTNTKFGLVDKRGNIWYQDRMRTTDHEQVGTFVEELYEKLQPMIEKVGGIDKIKGIGMGAPNGNYYKGTIEYAPNLKWKGIVPIATIVNEKFGIPAILANDADKPFRLTHFGYLFCRNDGTMNACINMLYSVLSHACMTIQMRIG